jgi:ubiquitin carboxyl-terminal hydrolase L3
MARTYECAIKPWESSSDVFTAGAQELGLSEELHFEDVLGLENPLPRGTVALILIYITPENYESEKARHAAVDKSTATAECQNLNVVWLPQNVQNACGPYALFHAVFNSNGRDHIGKPSSGAVLMTFCVNDDTVEGSFLHQIQEILMEASSYEERNTALKSFSELWNKCSAIGEMGLTLPSEDAEEDVEPHFVCFAGISGNLAMFDGDGMSGPEDLNVRLEFKGLMPDQALDAVKNHLEKHAHEERRYICTLLALVNTAI